MLKLLKNNSIIGQFALAIIAMFLVIFLVNNPALAQETTPEATAETVATVTALDFDKTMVIVSGTINILLVVVIGVIVFMRDGDALLTASLQKAQTDEKYIDTWREIFMGLNETMQAVVKVGVQVGKPLAKISTIDADDEFFELVEKITTDETREIVPARLDQAGELGDEVKAD